MILPTFGSGRVQGLGPWYLSLRASAFSVDEYVIHKRQLRLRVKFLHDLKVTRTPCLLGFGMLGSAVMQGFVHRQDDALTGPSSSF